MVPSPMFSSDQSLVRLPLYLETAMRSPDTSWDYSAPETVSPEGASSPPLGQCGLSSREMTAQAHLSRQH